MSTYGLVGWLFFVTLAIVLAVLVYQWQSTRRSEIKRGQKPGTLGLPGDPKP